MEAMKKSALPLALPLLFAVGAGATHPARAQQNAAPPNGGVTLQRPTDNGYDDLLAAIDLLRAKPSMNADPDAAPPPPSVFDKAQQPGATLADKRAAVHDPRFQLGSLALVASRHALPLLIPVH